MITPANGSYVFTAVGICLLTILPKDIDRFDCNCSEKWEVLKVSTTLRCLFWFYKVIKKHCDTHMCKQLFQQVPPCACGGNEATEFWAKLFVHGNVLIFWILMEILHMQLFTVSFRISYHKRPLTLPVTLARRVPGTWQCTADKLNTCAIITMYYS